MNDNGFIYVLINPSIEGLIKVGKTTRDPKERAEELSKATGVPTPFIVGYQMAVNDCSKAEEFVHTRLEQHGYRVSNNREFFNASMTEAINAIIEYKQSASDSSNYIKDNNETISNKMRIEVERLADDYLYGFNENILQDYKEALKYYEKAIKLGSSRACSRAGMMYKHGEGCVKNNEIALEYFKEAVHRGETSSYIDMMEIYLENKHIDNARKCWRKYIDTVDLKDVSFNIYNIYRYLENTYKYNLAVERLDILEKIKEEIWNEAIQNLEQWKAEDEVTREMIEYKEELNNYIKRILAIRV